MLYIRFFSCVFIFLSLHIGSISSHVQAAPSSPLTGDALHPPPRPRAHASTTSIAPERDMPSAFLAGSIAVRLVFIESDGSTTPSTEDWTSAQITQIQDQTRAALDWWTRQLPHARLSFDIVPQTVASRYEPIQHRLSTEGQWIGDVLQRLGFTEQSYFDQAYSADDALRQERGTNWATTIFVVNSANDSDGYFADDMFAYAYIGGPFMVITSDVGSYGLTNMAPVIAHELGHIFGALDQYEVAAAPCTIRSGYLAVANTNSQYNNCGTRFPSIMLDPVSAYRANQIDASALGQVGYRDGDGDTLPDPIDTIPALNISISQSRDGTRPHVTGQAVDQPFPAPTQRSTTINTITRVEYRIDDGEWYVLLPTDNLYDSAIEHFDTELPLYDGEHTVSLRAVNSVGTSSSILEQKVNIQGIGADPHVTVEVPSVQNSVALTAHVHAPEGVTARISEDPKFQDATWTAASQPLHYKLSPREGTHTVYIAVRDQNEIEAPLIVRQVILDQEAPTGSGQLQDGAPPTLAVQAQDNLSGVTSIQLVLTNGVVGEWQAYESSVPLASSAPAGQFRLRDAAGNVSAPLPVNRTYAVFLPLAQQP